MLSSATEHYRRQQRFGAAAVLEARRLRRDLGRLALTVAALQLAAARDSLAAVPDMLDEQDIDAPLVGSVPAAAFAGTASDGRPLVSLLEQASSPESLALMAVTQVQDAARQAASVSIAARPRIGWVRMLNPPSCSRCAVLAGRFYRFSQGFQRHPRCDCRHIPTTEDLSGDLTTDPEEYFRSLSAEQQDRIFTRGGAEAIRQGADMGQVVNARRGMSTAQNGLRLTSSSTGRRGVYRGPGQRLMPDSILEIAGNDRAYAQELFRRFGYLV